MANIVRRSRQIALGAAFISVMSGTGGLFGAVAGVMLALLARTVLHMDGGILEFVLTGMSAGLVGAMTYAMFLVAAQRPRFATESRPAQSLRLATQTLTEANETVAA